MLFVWSGDYYRLCYRVQDKTVQIWRFAPLIKQNCSTLPAIFGVPNIPVIETVWLRWMNANNAENPRGLNSLARLAKRRRHCWTRRLAATLWSSFYLSGAWWRWTIASIAFEYSWMSPQTKQCKLHRQGAEDLYLDWASHMRSTAMKRSSARISNCIVDSQGMRWNEEKIRSLLEVICVIL
jgi:hypothetical protein